MNWAASADSSANREADNMKPNLNPGVACTAHARVWSRREFLRTGGTAALAWTQSDAWAAPAETNGFLSPFFGFDREIQKFMQARNIPGGALSVAKDGRLAYTRGYG